MKEEGCRGTVRREIVKDKESEGEGPTSREERRKKMLSSFKGRYWREVNQKGHSQRETDNQIIHQLVHSDTLCIRTKKDCIATHLCISFIYLLNVEKEQFKYYSYWYSTYGVR